jgi:hypothetical protein
MSRVHSMRKFQAGSGPLAMLNIILLVTVVLGGALYWLRTSRVPQPIRFHTEYQAVLLNNSAVYFGRLQGWGTPFPVLTEVYYIQSGTDPQTKQVRNILLKRGSEWHAPDRMMLNAQSIAFVEPVGSDSKVAELIADLKKKR